MLIQSTASLSARDRDQINKFMAAIRKRDEAWLDSLPRFACGCCGRVQLFRVCVDCDESEQTRMEMKQ